MERLKNPLEDPGDIVDDQELLHSLRLFLATTNASDRTYTEAISAAMEHHPEDNLLLHAEIKARMAEVNGVSPLKNDMCPNSCLAYTGPFANDDFCRMCKEPRWDPNARGKVARQEFYTIPVGHQIQAMWRTPEGADNMRFRASCTREIVAEFEHNGGRLDTYDDAYCGDGYLEAVLEGLISDEDTVLLDHILPNASPFRLNLDTYKLAVSKCGDDFGNHRIEMSNCQKPTSTIPPPLVFDILTF